MKKDDECIGCEYYKFSHGIWQCTKSGKCVRDE